MTKIYWFALALITTGCVSHSNLFQDGKTLGKKEARASFNISLNSTPGIEPDSVNNQVDVDPYNFLAPWAQVQVQYGITDHLDAGGSFGLGLFSIGADVFAKYSFLPRESKTGVSLFGSGGLAGSNDKSVDNASTGYAHYLLSLPVSFDLSAKSTIVIQPIYEHQRYKYTIDGTSREYKGVFTANIYKLGIGFIHKHGNDLKVHYNVALNYWQADQKYWPSFGVAFSKP
jgi:hypothetical protein